MGWVVKVTFRPLYPWETPGTHCIGGWVDPRVVLDGFGKSRPHRDSFPDRPTRSESLYRLCFMIVRLTVFYSGDETRKYEVGRVCSMNGEEWRWIIELVSKI
jgi:hypothetical protein